MAEVSGFDRRFWFLPVALVGAAAFVAFAGDQSIGLREIRQEVFKALLEVVIVTCGVGAVLGWRRERLEAREAKNALLSRLTSIGRTLSVARWLMDAHKSVATWRDQMKVLASVHTDLDELSRAMGALKEKGVTSIADDFDRYTQIAQKCLGELLTEYSDKKNEVAPLQQNFEASKEAFAQGRQNAPPNVAQHWQGVLEKLTVLSSFLTAKPSLFEKSLNDAADLLNRELLGLKARRTESGTRPPNSGLQQTPTSRSLGRRS